jgi:hypothetical protein
VMTSRRVSSNSPKDVKILNQTGEQSSAARA